MLTVSADLKIHIAHPLADAAVEITSPGQYRGRLPLLETLLLPTTLSVPGADTAIGIARRSWSPDRRRELDR
jgi:hypothetical protein